MDPFTHGLTPYLLGSSFGLRRGDLTVLVLGGLAPDIDFLVLWIDHIYPTTFLITHRGITHSLLFGFFTVLALLFVLSFQRSRRALGGLHLPEPVLSVWTLALAYAGVILHLFLDYLTTRGIPLLYPLDAARWSFELFFYTETALTAVSLLTILVLLRYRTPGGNPVASSEGAGSVKRSRALLAMLLVVILVVAGIRVWGKEGSTASFTEGDIEAYPTPDLLRWDVLRGVDGGFEVYGYTLGGTAKLEGAFDRLRVSPEGLSSGTDLNRALQAANELPQVWTFRWRAYEVAVNASFEDGDWYLEFYDPLVKARLKDAPSIVKRAARRYGSIWVRVSEEEAEIIDRY